MSPPLTKRNFVSLFERGGDMGEVFVGLGGIDFFEGCGCRALFVGGARSEEGGEVHRLKEYALLFYPRTFIIALRMRVGEAAWQGA